MRRSPSVIHIYTTYIGCLNFSEAVLHHAQTFFRRAVWTDQRSRSTGLFIHNILPSNVTHRALAERKAEGRGENWALERAPTGES